MQALLIKCAIRSTLIAAAAGLVLLVMSIKAPSARHAVWAGVILAMFALPALVVWGPKAPLPVLRPASRSAALPIPPDPVGQAPGLRGAPAVPHGGSQNELADCGLPGWRLSVPDPPGNRHCASKGTAWRKGFMCAPVTVGWLRPTVIFPPDWPQWPQGKLDAVLTHEREDARRRDPFWRFVALLNRALFWFHPLAWWRSANFRDWPRRPATRQCWLMATIRVTIRNFCWTWRVRSGERARASERSAWRCRASDWNIAFDKCSAAIPHRESRGRMAGATALCTIAAAIFAAGTLVRAQSGSRGLLEFEVASVRPSHPNGGIGGFKTKDGKRRRRLAPNTQPRQAQLLRRLVRHGCPSPRH